MATAYVLDASALLDLVEDGAGADHMERLFQEAARRKSVLLMSVVNWGEVFYQLWRRRGGERARHTLNDLSRLPLGLVSVDLAQVLIAGEIKAVHHLAYVDCLAAALTEMHEAVLVTTDRDFERLGRRVEVLWLPRR